VFPDVIIQHGAGVSQFFPSYVHLPMERHVLLTGTDADSFLQLLPRGVKFCIGRVVLFL
jgi:hypothetical protein